MRLRAYPKYKQSGVEWLGDVPTHWESRRIRYLFRFASGGTPNTNVSDYWDGSIPWVSAKDMRPMVITDTEDHISEEAVRSSATTMIPSGSILIVTRSGILRHSLPASVIKRDMAINQDLKGCVPRSDVSALYFAYLIQGNQRQLLTLWRQQGATVESLDFESIKASNVTLPPFREQRTIADFLDRETARLDTLVGKKRELIEKLKEKRTALVSRAVTGGLNPNIKLKPSGIEWLGEIPKHWNAKRLKHAAVVTTGFAFSSDDFTSDGVPVLRIGDIDQEGQVSLVESKFLPVDYLRRHSNVLVRKGDIVMAMTGATIGKVGRYVENTPALLNQRVCIFRAVETSEQAFLWYLLNSEFYIEHVVLTAFGGAQPNISDTELLSCPVPLPDKPEQRAIANYLDRETAKIDKMMEKVEAAIAKLQEYRTALITATVTGKIDVRAVDR